MLRRLRSNHVWLRCFYGRELRILAEVCSKPASCRTKDLGARFFVSAADMKVAPVVIKE